MKSTFVALTALAAGATAQNGSNLPSCGQICVDNMLSVSKANELGCPPGDRGCLCLNPNFTYGVRDCSRALCDEDQVSGIVEYAISLCSGAGVSVVTTEGSASVTRTGEPSLVTPSTGAASGSPSGSPSGTPDVTTVTGTVSTIYTVSTSDGTPVSTPIGTTLIGGGLGGIGGSASSAASSAASGAGGLVTTISSGGSAIVSTITSAAGSAGSSAASAASSALESGSSRASDIANSASSAISSVLSEVSSAAGDATSSDPEGAAVPQKTAAPIGMLAAAGVAAFLL